MSTSMKWVNQRGNATVEITEFTIEPPGPGEVLIATGRSAICGSEMNNYRTTGKPLGGNAGHEAAGEIVDVGPGVDAQLIGRRVGVSAVVGCGSCDSCAEGIYTWCPKHAGMSNLHAEAFVIPLRACHLLPDDIADDVGTLISGDGLGVPYHTQQRLADRSFERVAIFGLGPVGLGSVMLQSFLGRQVVAVDYSTARLAYARDLGADEVVTLTDDMNVAEAVADACGGRPPEVCIEATGKPGGVRSCFSSVANGGRVVFNGEQGPLELSPSEDFIRRDISALGAWFYHFHEFSGMVEMFRAGLPLQKLITHTVPLASAADGYQLMADGESGKVMISY